MTALETKVRGTFRNSGALPWAQIIAMILAMLQSCPTPAPPKNTGFNRWRARRYVRNYYGLDEAAMQDWGYELAEDALSISTASTQDEWTQYLKDANAAA